MAESTELVAPTTCYPEGVPDGFPVDLFAPVDGSELVIREAKLRKKIDDLQRDLGEYPQTEIAVTNTFSGGVYAREIFIPKGTTVIGKVHLTEHLNICLKGDLTFLTVDGPKRIKGPMMFSAPAGTKKLAYANEDSIWVNVHPALCDDPEQIVDALTVDSYADLDRLLSKADLEYKVAQFGFTPELMHEISVDEDTLDPTPIDGVDVRPSELHGLGLFAVKDFQRGESICKVRDGDKRTLAGRYSNHSPVPNCAVRLEDGQLILVALRGIEIYEELTTDYGDTLSVVTLNEELV